MKAENYLNKFSSSDLQKNIDRAIYPFGRYQIFLFIVLCINSVIIALNHALTTFHIYTPKEFYCTDETLVASENSTCISDCKNYEFEDLYSSPVTEWNLICDRRYLSALLNTFYFTGVTIGNLICGVLADKWGRKKLVMICLYSQGVFGIILYFSEDFLLFTLLRCIQGFFTQGLQIISYSLMQELTPTRFLTLTGLVWEVFWALGMVALGGIAYAIPDFRDLQLALTIPTVITLFWCWFIPESPAWKLTKNKNLSALKTAFTIAKLNKDKAYFEEVANLPEAKVNESEITDSIETGKMIDLARHKILLKHLLVMIGVWFSVTLSYNGMMLYIPSLDGNAHLNFTVSSSIEIIAYIVAYFLLSSSFFGRRYSMVMYQYASAACCLSLGLLTINQDKAEWIAGIIVPIAHIGKGVAVSAFAGMFIQAAELFPTVVRSSAFGIFGFSARVGSLLAPQIILLGELINPMVPLGIMAVLLLISGSAGITVPETVNKDLPNTLADVDKVWGTKSTKDGL